MTYQPSLIIQCQKPSLLKNRSGTLKDKKFINVNKKILNSLVLHISQNAKETLTLQNDLDWFGVGFITLFNSISTFMGYLIPKPSFALSAGAVEYANFTLQRVKTPPLNEAIRWLGVATCNAL